MLMRSLWVGYPKELKAGAWRDICTPVFIAALFTVARRWKQCKCPPEMGRKKGIWWEQIAVLGTVLAWDLGTLCFLHVSISWWASVSEAAAKALGFLSLREWGVCLNSSSLESWVRKAWHISSLTFTQVWHLQKPTRQHILSKTKHAM